MGGGVVGYRVAVEDDMRRASHDGGEVRVKENPRSSNGSRGQRFSKGLTSPSGPPRVFLLLLREARQRITANSCRKAHDGHKKTAMSVRGLRPRSLGFRLTNDGPCQTGCARHTPCLRTDTGNPRQDRRESEGEGRKRFLLSVDGATSSAP